MSPVTPQQLRGGVAAVIAVSEAIREAGSIPAGTLYAMLCDRVDMSGFDRLIAILKGAGLVEVRAHVIRWIGPEVGR